MSIDVIGDFLTIIRNGIMASKSSVKVPHSNMKYELARILKDEGFIRDFSLVSDGEVKKQIHIFLKYVKVGKNGQNESVIHEIKRRSRPGRRYYASIAQIKPIIGGMGISIISTNQGIVTDKQARARAVGGEVICSVW